MRKSKKELIITIVFIALMVLGLIFGYVGVFTNTNWMVLIFGIIAILSMVVNLFTPLIFKGRISPLSWASVIVSLILTIVFVCVAIINIRDDETKDVVIPVASACISGLLTLYGVALTIKHNGIENREMEMRKYVPHIYSLPKAMLNGRNPKVANLFYLLGNIYEGNSIVIDDIFFANTDQSIFTFDGIMLNNEFIKFEYEYVILKETKNRFRFNFELDYTKPIKNVWLVFTDSIFNIYALETNFELKTSKDGKQHVIINSYYRPKLLENHYYAKQCRKEDRQ